MQFGNYQAFNLFLGVIILAGFYIWAFIARKKATEKFIQANLIGIISDSFDVKSSLTKAAILVLAYGLCVVALSRPQWGFKWEEVKRKGVDIFIALDVSKSMLAEDVKPNRLERSKMAILDLLKNLQGDRIGLIAFSGSAFIQCPLTSDYNGFLLSLNDIDTNVIPKGGTDISSAIKEALYGFEGGGKKYRVLIIISDGENLQQDAEVAASKAQKEGVKIYCVGIGSLEGELISVTDETGSKAFLKDREGRVVKTRLNEPLLEKIALATGASYVRATAADFGLDTLYDERISKMEKRELQSKVRKRYYERFQIPLLIALVLIMLEPFMSERKGQWV